MGDFYTVYFANLWAVFVDLLCCRAMEQMAQLFPYFRNSRTSLFNVLASIVAASPALVIHLKTQSV